MLFAESQPVRFVNRVGVAPSTTTMVIDEPIGARKPIAPMPLPAAPSAPKASSSPAQRYFMPYTSLEELRSGSSGFGIINESDAWLTGRPYGLPGTATVRLMQRPGGYHSPDGYHYNASMLGDADTAAMTVVLQQIAEAQRAQQKAIDRIAFWQTMAGGLTLGMIAVGATIGIVRYARGR